MPPMRSRILAGDDALGSAARDAGGRATGLRAARGGFLGWTLRVLFFADLGADFAAVLVAVAIQCS
jgi:hypothetical protein